MPKTSVYVPKISAKTPKISVKKRHLDQELVQGGEYLAQTCFLLFAFLPEVFSSSLLKYNNPVVHLAYMLKIYESVFYCDI